MRASAGHDAHADDLQRRHQRDGARMQARLHHPRRHRDRRRLDQGLHDPAGRPVPADAGAGASCAAACSDAQEAHAPEGACATCRWRCRRCWRWSRRSSPGPQDFAQQGERAVPRPRPALPDRARRRAEAQGDQLHPRRGLPGRRTQARPAGAGRRRRCRWSRWRRTTRCWRSSRATCRKCARAAASCTCFADGDTRIETQPTACT